MNYNDIFVEIVILNPVQKKDYGSALRLHENFQKKSIGDFIC